MDRHECRVISDATSVQPLCHSRIDLSIIGLVAEEVEAEVAVRGVEEVLGNVAENKKFPTRFTKIHLGVHLATSHGRVIASTYHL